MNGKCKLQPSVYMRAEGTFACKKKVTVKHVWRRIHAALYASIIIITP